MLQARWSLTHQYKFLVVKDDHLAAQYGSLITENSNKGCLVILAGMHTYIIIYMFYCDCRLKGDSRLKG